MCLAWHPGVNFKPLQKQGWKALLQRDICRIHGTVQMSNTCHVFHSSLFGYEHLLWNYHWYVQVHKDRIKMSGYTHLRRSFFCLLLQSILLDHRLPISRRMNESPVKIRIHPHFWTKVKIEPGTFLPNIFFKGPLLIWYLLLESFYFRYGKHTSGYPTTLFKYIQFIFVLAQSFPGCKA